MVKSKKQDNQAEDEAVIIEKMNQALKRMMDTPPETHKEMIERRRGQTNKPAPRKSQR